MGCFCYENTSKWFKKKIPIEWMWMMRVRGLVWVHPRSMNAYTNFGDVVRLNSTYQTDRYCMVFLRITRINHHYQNLFFRFVLIRDETEASYKWVLRTWLEAVDSKPPKTIITDQYIVFKNAIAEVMPMPPQEVVFVVHKLSGIQNGI